MKKDRLFYWIATAMVALMGVAAGVMYFMSPVVAIEFKHLGFPDYFRVELGLAKILGGLTLIIPIISNRIKEWAYTGFAIAFISAIVAHIAVESLTAAISPMVALLLLVISYFYFHKLKDHTQP